MRKLLFLMFICSVGYGQTYVDPWSSTQQKDSLQLKTLVFSNSLLDTSITFSSPQGGMLEAWGLQPILKLKNAIAGDTSSIGFVQIQPTSQGVTLIWEGAIAFPTLRFQNSITDGGISISKTGAITSDGDVTVGGNLSVTGTSVFTGAVTLPIHPIFSQGFDSTMITTARTLPIYVSGGETLDTVRVISEGAGSVRFNIYSGTTIGTATDSIFSSNLLMTTTNGESKVTAFRNSGVIAQSKRFWVKFTTVTTGFPSIYIQADGHGR